tara:strand:- start:1999 stop:2304 length:306 start_codon:yes stop_codon:yes gene_type:complete
MKPKEIIQQIEHLMGRQPEGYMIRLMNDGLLDMTAKKQEYTVSSTTDLVQYKRWYALDDQMIDITKIEILDSNNRYVRIPKLVDSHLLLRDDTESGADTLK